jgi:hypothetical protein
MMKMPVFGAIMTLRRLVCTEVGPAWCSQPAQQLDPGCSEAPPIVAPILGSTQTRFYQS